MAERLQKFLAKSGIGSRRYCEELIKSGKVLVNGEIPKIGISVGESDIVEVDGKVISSIEAETKLLMLNKPEGVLSSSKREKDIPIIFDFLPKTKIEVAVSDDNADAVIDAISKVSNTGKIGDGKIFVSSLEQVVRIRTGELNEDAL